MYLDLVRGVDQSIQDGIGHGRIGKVLVTVRYSARTVDMFAGLHIRLT